MSTAYTKIRLRADAPIFTPQSVNTDFEACVTKASTSILSEEYFTAASFKVSETISEDNSSSEPPTSSKSSSPSTSPSTPSEECFTSANFKHPETSFEYKTPPLSPSANLSSDSTSNSESSTHSTPLTNPTTTASYSPPTLSTTEEHINNTNNDLHNLPSPAYHWLKNATTTLQEDLEWSHGHNATAQIPTLHSHLQTFTTTSLTKSWHKNLDWKNFPLPTWSFHSTTLTTSADEFFHRKTHMAIINEREFWLPHHIHDWFKTSMMYIFYDLAEKRENPLEPRTLPLCQFLSRAEEGGWFERGGWLEFMDWSRFPMLEEEEDAEDLYWRAVDMMGVDEDGKGQEESVGEDEIECMMGRTQDWNACAEP
ncbi:hypothetical protein E2P81_ATG04571 [Venturia nashicola]|nr:hypothetical protein E2P81_ATG04571 [Venturia nashicola]